ncbi:hypothetical protein K502DRAFT_325301 [Neoconidiobolus thromboides FSU 785]|nr:hypothetical protein K502DRAFT_325301 [Neoconidiobolus thromboides FSU 785]
MEEKHIESDAIEPSSTEVHPVKSTLGNILETNSEDEDNIEVGAVENEANDSENNSDNVSPADQGFCVECRDQKAGLFCEQCDEDFCEVCFHMIHRTGKRKNHSTKSLQVPQANAISEQISANPSNSRIDSLKSTPNSTRTSTPIDQEIKFDSNLGTVITTGSSFGEWIIERSKYIPLRLSVNDRKKLRLLESALNVSEYVDKIDILMYGNKNKRIVHQIKDICAILSGLMVACDYRRGQQLFATKSFEENEFFFQDLFEIGRRYKVMNPEKMRTAYGKLMFLLQDSCIPEVQEMLGFSCIKPIATVYNFLQERNGLELLNNEHMMQATKEIIAEGKSRSAIQMEIKLKERSIEFLSQKYSNENLTPDEIKTCLYSIGDNHAYLRFNRDPCDRMLKYLSTYFSPNKPSEIQFNLAIASGRGGARLSHSHETQYQYVHQTLTLWREILHDMFMFWYYADEDLLGPNIYRLRDTGQGLNRVQNCPNVSKIAHRTLHRAQQKVGYWVGSSVIHLGDRNVPNALVFIDKYNQVARILNPIVRCLEYLDNLEERRKMKEYDNGLLKYINNTFESIANLRKVILADFFRSAFDGSGADNFFDAGSCIDGRLTSAWNWCSSIEKKPFFPVFLMTGFNGFDGEWGGN